MKDKLRYRLGFSISVIIIGLLLASYGVGREGFLGFGSVGEWLIYTGFIGVSIILINNLRKEERQVDERMIFVAHKSNRWTFLLIILTGFIVMVWDGIQPIKLSYSLFMSYFICGVIVTYLIVYKALLKKY